MKNRILTLIVIYVFSCAYAYAISVTISSGIENAELKTRMEAATARLLEEVNAAHAAGRGLELSALGFSQSFQKSMSKLWGNCPFVCDDDEIVESCITTSTGYQIRNIPLLIKYKGDSAGEGEHENAVICFDSKGDVEHFYLGIPPALYAQVIRANDSFKDMHHCQVILDYAEHLRTSFIQKDTNYMKQAYNDNNDCLIIIGKVVRQANGSSPTIKYVKSDWHQYLKNLSRSLSKTKELRVSIDEIEVVHHPVKTDFYGVTLHQVWSSNNYQDGGYIFLLWDFQDESAPQIQVMTWQPDKIGNKALPKDEIFTLIDFDI